MWIGDAMGRVKRHVHGDLELLKEFIEARGFSTVARRGEIHSGHQSAAQPSKQINQPARGPVDWS